jgi:hypothetical protein
MDIGCPTPTLLFFQKPANCRTRQLKIGRWFFALVLKPLPARPSHLLRQLHEIAIIVGLVPATLQMLNARGKVTLQRRELALLEGVGFNPPTKKFDLFVQIQFRRRCFDFFHGTHTDKLSQLGGSCPLLVVGMCNKFYFPPPTTRCQLNLLVPASRDLIITAIQSFKLRNIWPKNI